MKKLLEILQQLEKEEELLQQKKEEESRHKLWLRERLLPQKEGKKAFEMVEDEYLATS